MALLIAAASLFQTVAVASLTQPDAPLGEPSHVHARAQAHQGHDEADSKSPAHCHSAGECCCTNAMSCCIALIAGLFGTYVQGYSSDALRADNCSPDLPVPKLPPRAD